MGEREHCLSLWFIRRPLQPGGYLPESWQLLYSPPKWHLKCEAMAVLVAQSPQAGPRTWALNPEPSFFALRSQTLEPSSPHSDTCFTVMIEHVKSDLKYSCCPRSDVSSNCSFYVMLCSVSLVCFPFLYPIFGLYLIFLCKGQTCICSVYLKPWFPAGSLPFLFSLLHLCFKISGTRDKSAPNFGHSFTWT